MSTKSWRVMIVPLERIGRTRIVMFVAGVVVVAILVTSGAMESSNSTTANAAAAPQAIAVDSALAVRADVPIYLDGLGTVQAFNTVTITPRVDGELLKVGFVEGQTVKKGDLLAQIDPRPYQAALDQAIATKEKDSALLDNARRDLTRFTTLAPQDLTSKQTLDTQRSLVNQLVAQVKGDQAAIDNARTQLAYTTITSPIDGITGIRQVDPGNNLHAASATGIVVVTQIHPIAVIFTLPEGEFGAVSHQMAMGRIAVTAMSHDGATTLGQGTVTLIDNQIDQTTGTIRLKAIFPNTDNKLWPGQFVDVRVLLETRHNALTVPSAAIQRGPNGLFAYVVKPDSTVEVRPLKIVGSTANNAAVIVTAGLHAGERVTTSNEYRLQRGARVSISSPGKTAADAQSGAS